MIDGIIRETQNSRKIFAALPATYEELVALAQEMGIPADIVIDEEGWQQLPTWLNKANLLSDNTEQAIWGDAGNRTVDSALKMLSDVAYGRVAQIVLTVLDTEGNPIPDVTVKLDATPTVGQDSITDENGILRISTNGGTHTINLVYPVGFSAETESRTVEVTGTRNETIQSVSRSSSAYYMLKSSRTIYIARHLYPIQIDLRGGGGSGGCVTFSSNYDRSANGGAGGYVNITTLNTPGKLVVITVGSGGARYGYRGGTTRVAADGTTLTALGGAGGSYNNYSLQLGKNTDGGAYGGGAAENGEDGRYLFDDSTLPRFGGGGGGGYVNRYELPGVGQAGAGGGTAATINGNSNDATTAGGSGAAITIRTTSYSGKGGDGFVAFRKAV